MHNKTTLKIKAYKCGKIFPLHLTNFQYIFVFIPTGTNFLFLETHKIYNAFSVIKLYATRLHWKASTLRHWKRKTTLHCNVGKCGSIFLL